MPNWLQIAKKLNNNSIEEFALGFCKNVMGKKSFLGKRTMGVFEKSDLLDLPTIFAERIKGLKYPKVKIKNNCSQDYNCFAFSISESGKPVEQFVMSLDTATGAPVLNVSRKAFQEGEVAFSGRYLADTSKTVARGSKPTFSMAQDNVSLSISDADYAHWLDIKFNKQLSEQLTQRSGITIPNEKQILRIHKNAQSPKQVNEEMAKIKEAAEPTVIPKYKPVGEMNVVEINNEMSKLSKQIKKLEKEIYQGTFGNVHKRLHLPKRAKYNPATGECLLNQSFVNSKQYANKNSKLYELKCRLAELDIQKCKLMPPKPNMKFLQEIMEQYHLGSLPQKHPQMAKIKRLQTLPIEQSVKESKKLFSQEIGIPEELINIEKMSASEEIRNILGNTGAYFDPITATLRYSTSKLNSMDIPYILRHEMDHLEKFAKVGKSVGMKRFKELVCKGNPEMEQYFNEQAWEKIFQKVNIEGFDAEPYINAIKTYSPAEGQKAFAYYGNLLEQSAYKMGASVNPMSTEQYVHSRISETIIKKVDELKSVLGEKFNSESYIKDFEYLTDEKSLMSKPGYIIKADIKVIDRIERDISIAKCVKKNNFAFDKCALRKYLNV